MKIIAVAIDTGGHRTKTVYDYCRPRYRKGIYAIKGAKVVDAPMVNMRPSFRNKGKVPLFSIGVNVAKDDLYSKLIIDEPGAGYMHFPQKEIYDKNYFKQLTVERRGKDGRWVNPSKKRNEATDCRVYSMAALALSGRDISQMTRPIFFIQKQVKKRRILNKGIGRSHLNEY